MNNQSKILPCTNNPVRVNMRAARDTYKHKRGFTGALDIERQRVCGCCGYVIERGEFYMWRTYLRTTYGTPVACIACIDCVRRHNEAIARKARG